MKKTLLASAIAAATFSGSVFAQESMPTIYGNIQLAHFWNEAEDANGKTIDSESSHEFADGGSTIGIKHDHEIAPGLTGFLKAELEFDADDKEDSGGLNGLDEAFIGVRGDFGSVQVGSDDTAYEQMINITDTSEQIGLGGNLAANEEGRNAQYMGTFGAISVGATQPIDDTSETESTQLAASYSADMVMVSLGYAMSRDAKDGTKGQDAFGLAAQLDLAPLTLQAQYENQEESQSGANDGSDYMAAQALYSIGASVFVAGYGVYGTDSNAATAEDESKVYLQAKHNVSDNMYVYIEANQSSDYKNVKDQDNTATAVGATYYF